MIGKKEDKTEETQPLFSLTSSQRRSNGNISAGFGNKLE
jgi:hypothetical protein